MYMYHEAPFAQYTLHQGSLVMAKLRTTESVHNVIMLFSTKNYMTCQPKQEPNQPKN